ncbi:hypothetical protein SLEP1_g38746 [Rubroshorea leprosula]|nr:hypothetical protein SLEP1_g38746 [Rubroshorea leprosula]
MESRDPDDKAGKNPVRNQKRDRQGEGSSSSAPYNSSTPTSSHIAITDGQKKGAMDRIKRLKKYLCFGSF